MLRVAPIAASFVHWHLALLPLGHISYFCVEEHAGGAAEEVDGEVEVDDFLESDLEQKKIIQ